MNLSKRDLPLITCFPPKIPSPSSKTPSCNASVIHTWAPRAGQSWSQMLVPPLLFSLPNNYSSSISWALGLRQSPGICRNADHRMSEARGSLRNTDWSMLISTLLYNCWWLLELSDKSFDNNSLSWAQRWFRKHILIEEQATVSDVGYSVPH